MRVCHSVRGGLCVSECTWVTYVCIDVHGAWCRGWVQVPVPVLEWACGSRRGGRRCGCAGVCCCARSLCVRAYMCAWLLEQV